MSGDGTALHREVWALIPWVLNGSASAEDGEQVRAHLRECADCRAEYEFQQQLRQGMAQPLPAAEVDAGRALGRFWQQGEEPARPAPRRRSWLAAAVIVQAMGLATLGTLLALRSPAEYRVLGSQPAATRAVIRIVPAPGMQVGELRALLARSDLQLVETGAELGHLGVALAPGARFGRDEALQRLRAEPGLLLVEPVVAP
ncbi:zf-HC2 domain-containing protein [Pelomonas sp. KK5]|uniref:zf-HC2 domain-containing protein n=1 Tax=Pelomonas sp. KK5 TaxID=1855730 RepID=UPI00097C937A|nr:zf-HC2 domain-containing protein [Pelomonas sp. KK5]